MSQVVFVSVSFASLTYFSYDTVLKLNFFHELALLLEIAVGFFIQKD